MTIFKRKESEEYLTVSEVKAFLEDVEAERAADEDRELRYELARAIEHVNRFAATTAIKIADLLPQSRDELRAVYAQERYALDGDELDEVLNVVAKYV
jgi:DNA-directed RNA polymerase subunit F